MAVIDTIQAQPSKEVKRKRDNDDDALARIQSLLAQVTSDDEGDYDKDDDREKDNEDDEDVSIELV